MRIDSWPMDKVMQLPDCAFGRRFLVSCTVSGTDAGEVFDISEIALPERCVIWELSAYCDSLSSDLAHFRMALGDQLPADAAAMSRLQPLFNGLGLQGAGPRRIVMPYVGDMRWNRLRFGIESAGCRLVLEALAESGKVPVVTVGIVVSSVPREVPD